MVGRSDQTKIFGLLLLTGIVMGTKFLQKKKQQSLLETKLADVERYASTDHLLMMNGVDHQPVQRDITKAIALPMNYSQNMNLFIPISMTI